MSSDWICPICSITCPRQTRTTHVLSYHKNHPRFKIFCSYPGCTESYSKWNSFTRHVKRAHSEDQGQTIAQPRLDEEMFQEPIRSDSDEIISHDSHEALKRFKLLTSLFLIRIKQASLLPQSTAESIMDHFQYLYRDLLSLLQAEILNSSDANKNVSSHRIQQIFYDACTVDLFEYCRSSYQQDKFLAEYCDLVSPTETKLGFVPKWTKDMDIIDTQAIAYTVPFLQNLQTVLNNEEVLECVDNPRPFDGETLKTVLDGRYYRNHPVFLRNPKALSIIIYYDDVEYCNPLGSKSRKIGMFYWTLGNIHPELRSSIRSVFLLAVLPSFYVKRFGARAILKGFLTEMKKLSSAEGVVLDIQGVNRKFTGILHFIAGDTPASNLLAVFKEGVGSAFRPCRCCMVNRDEIDRISSLEQTNQRDIESYKEQVSVVTDLHLSRQALKYWSRFYGVNSRSCFLDVDVDVTKLFPHDAMHILMEGVLECHIRTFVSFCIENDFFTLEDLNTSIQYHDYDVLVKDKPSVIDGAHLQAKLKQSAAQLLTLGFSLPFLIEKWIDRALDSHVRCFVTLLQITNLLLAFELKSEDAYLLKRMIAVHQLQFKNLYPAVKLTPKFHYLLHLPDHLLELGPIRQQWCFRFEANHQYFKKIARRNQNFRNITKTFANRVQALKSTMLTCFLGTSM